MRIDEGVVYSDGERQYLPWDVAQRVIAERDRYRNALRAIARYVAEGRLQDVAWIVGGLDESFDTVAAFDDAGHPDAAAMSKKGRPSSRSETP